MPLPAHPWRTRSRKLVREYRQRRNDRDRGWPHQARPPEPPRWLVQVSVRQKRARSIGPNTTGASTSRSILRRTTSSDSFPVGVRNHPTTYLGSSMRCSVEARGLYKKREWIEREVIREIVSEQAKPTILRDVSELLTLLWTLVFEAKHILKMMNQLMNEHG